MIAASWISQKSRNEETVGIQEILTDREITVVAALRIMAVAETVIIRKTPTRQVGVVFATLGETNKNYECI